LLVVCRGWLVNMRGLAASKSLHTDLIQTILNANTGFFMANPTGRLLNRFSRDMNMVDAMLPMQFDQIFSMFTMLIGALITTAVISPLYIVGLFPGEYSSLSLDNRQ
jgi:ABC-type multidrug transport system fused ATPase/permease subunit